MVKGSHMTEEQRLHDSVMHMGHCPSDETRAKLSASHMNQSQETRDKISLAGMGNKRSLGWHHSEATREQMFIAHTGRPKGSCSSETRAKISAAKWRGGPLVTNRKHWAKRRALGFVPMNQSFIGCEGHHINQNDVIYIPAELHVSIRHNVWTGKNMDQINALATSWLTEDRTKE